MVDVRREAVWGEPIALGERTLTPLAERWIVATGEPGALRLAGWLQPLGVVVEGPDGSQAIGLDGQALPFSPSAEG